MTDSKQIVVGYDGSTEAKQAVTWAARQAVPLGTAAGQSGRGGQQDGQRGKRGARHALRASAWISPRI